MTRRNFIITAGVVLATPLLAVDIKERKIHRAIHGDLCINGETIVQHNSFMMSTPSVKNPIYDKYMEINYTNGWSCSEESQNILRDGGFKIE